MQQSQIAAKIYGIGELITQRKHFTVPEHQRNFSWRIDEVEQYLSDLDKAFAKDAPDYFIGLIVFQGLIDNSWLVLDGQQRLATTTMIFSAIREWLLSRNYKDDANQIEKEFIGVRQLGGLYTPRLKLNNDNQQIFNQFIVDSSPISDISQELKKWTRNSTNRLLLEATAYCRSWIENFCSKASTERERQANELFRLSSYIENRVKAVIVDVTSETNAYILFESLNFRGADLSALDLVKNYIFSYATNDNIINFRHCWENITKNIEGKDADDFLKVFWTSRFGIVQKLDLFDRIRQKYKDENGVEVLIEELADASEKFSAIEDPDNQFWQEISLITKDKITQLNILGGRQTRSVILSALSKFSPPEIDSLLWILIVLIVRYQLIGRGRTGILEQSMGRLSQKIWNGEVKAAYEVINELSSIMPDDETFFDNFTSHSETKALRISYLLAQLEIIKRFDLNHLDLDPKTGWRTLSQNAFVSYLLPPWRDLEDSEKTLYSRLGNYVLTEVNHISKWKELNSANIHLESYLQPDSYLHSGFILTNTVYNLPEDVLSISRPVLDKQLINMRSAELASIAVRTWSISSPIETA
jgi:uncharacterized protein with ParB-like and HNH nuclease domain